MPLSQPTPVSDNTAKMIVTIISPVFQEGNKWRFSDGEVNFNAAIADDAFLQMVDRGERFGKGTCSTWTCGSYRPAQAQSWWLSERC